MSREVFEIVQGMDLKNIETQLALQCAPLITGIKISNLLIVSKEDEKLVRAILKNTGISSYRLLRTEEKITLLLFRRAQLEVYLTEKEVRDIFAAEGYQTFALGEIFRIFQKRYESYMNGGTQFPHEMGLLLGYPAEDVTGFMENEGRNFLYAGYWKVYAHKDAKIALFRKFEDAKETLIHLISNGVSIGDIIEIYNENELRGAAV